MRKLIIIGLFLLSTPLLLFADMKIKKVSGTDSETWIIEPEVQFSTGSNRGSIYMNLETLEIGTTVYIDKANTYFKVGDNTVKIVDMTKNMKPKDDWASYFTLYIKIIAEYFK